jgi:ABC-2 type transport system permease protein
MVELLNRGGEVRAEGLSTTPGGVPRVSDSLASRVQLGAIDGFLVLVPATLDGGPTVYRGSAVSAGDTPLLQAVLRQAVIGERLRRYGVDPEVVARAEAPVTLRTESIRAGRSGGPSDEATFVLAYAVWFLLYLAILLYGVQVMGSVVEEKTTRMVEVLVSSVEPFRLLAGKIVGVGAVGLLQMSIWAGCGKLVLDRRADLAQLAAPGGQAASVLAGLTLPTVPVAMVVVALAYFLLGFFLYAAMFAAVGAMVNSEAEARQAQVPVVLLLMVPTVLMIAIVAEPDGSWARWLSQVPLTAPIAMPVRYAAGPVPITQLAVSLLVLAVAVVAVVWVAGRIYRVGILMYGKKPGLREVLRWVLG